MDYAYCYPRLVFIGPATVGRHEKAKWRGKSGAAYYADKNGIQHIIQTTINAYLLSYLLHEVTCSPLLSRYSHICSKDGLHLGVNETFLQFPCNYDIDVKGTPAWFIFNVIRYTQ